MSKEAASAARTEKASAVNLDPKFITKLTVTLLGICVVVALLLGVVNYVTKPIIDQMKEEKTAAAMGQVLQADEYVPVETDAASVKAMYQAVAGGEQVGYVAEVTANGFGGAISMVVGVDMSGAVTGVAVTDNSETANVGTKVVGNQDVLDRFIGMSHADGEITVNSGSNRFDGVSGATVSSRGVTAGVNAALAAVGALAE